MNKRFLIFKELPVENEENRSALIPCDPNLNANAINDSINTINFQWYVNSSDVRSLDSLKGRISITANGYLLINRFTSQDHGSYKCVIKDGEEPKSDVTIQVDNKSIIKYL